MLLVKNIERTWETWADAYGVSLSDVLVQVLRSQETVPQTDCQLSKNSWWAGSELMQLSPVHCYSDQVCKAVFCSDSLGCIKLKKRKCLYNDRYPIATSWYHDLKIPSWAFGDRSSRSKEWEEPNTNKKLLITSYLYVSITKMVIRWPKGMGHYKLRLVLLSLRQ